MLKITYTETGIAIEQLTISPEAIIAQRSILALRVGRPMAVQPGYGTLLLSTRVKETMALLQSDEFAPNLTLAPCEPGWFEVTLQGLWIAEFPNSEQGLFIVELASHLEQKIADGWRQSLAWHQVPAQLPNPC